MLVDLVYYRERLLSDCSHEEKPIGQRAGRPGGWGFHVFSPWGQVESLFPHQFVTMAQTRKFVQDPVFRAFTGASLHTYDGLLIDCLCG